MKRLIFSLILAFPLSAVANNELNGDDVTANHQMTRTADPSAQSVVIQFDKNGVPVSVAHSSEKIVKTSELNKLQFAQLTLSAEDPKNLNESTPATELQDAQGTPQWGMYGGGIRGGAIYRGPNGGVAAIGGRAVWGGGWGGYGGGYGGYYGGAGYYGGGYYGGGYGYGGYYPSYAAAGWTGGCGGYYGGCGGCGGGCAAPVYYYSGCAYAPVAYYGGYALYQPYY